MRMSDWSSDVCSSDLVLETDLGPVVNTRAADRIESMIEEARARGARIVCGPNRKGCVIDPTIIVDAPEDARVVREEVFGPVAVTQIGREACRERVCQYV